MPLPPTERPDFIGQTVGNYKIIRKVSAGGMGTVYYAEHTLIGKGAAVKVLHPELSHNKDIVQRFFNEAKATTSIHHPGIVEVYDYGYLDAGDGYLVMEFLDGMSLARRVKKGGRYGEGEAAMLVRGVSVALAAAHAKGIIHRDLKPDNIFLVVDAESPIGERPKLLDFGIAKLTDVGLAGSATRTGAVMGTPTYMSPEQCRGTGNVDHRADLYSLGCILYELMCGRPPFTQLGAGELIGAHQYAHADPPSKHRPEISQDMERLIVSLLDKDPASRVQTATELARLLAKLAAKHGYHISLSHLTPVPTTAATTDPVSRTELAPEPTTHDPTTLTRSAAESVASATPPPRATLWKLAPVIAVLAAAAVVVVTVRVMRDDPSSTPHGAAAPVAPPALVAPPAPAAAPEQPAAAPTEPAAPPTEAATAPTEPAAAPTEPTIETTSVAASPTDPPVAGVKPSKPPSKHPARPPRKPPKPPPKPPVKPVDPPKPPPNIGPIETDI